MLEIDPEFLDWIGIKNNFHTKLNFSAGSAFGVMQFLNKKVFKIFRNQIWILKKGSKLLKPDSETLVFGSGFSFLNRIRTWLLKSLYKKLIDSGIKLLNKIRTQSYGTQRGLKQIVNRIRIFFWLAIIFR